MEFVISTNEPTHNLLMNQFGMNYLGENIIDNLEGLIKVSDEYSKLPEEISPKRQSKVIQFIEHLISEISFKETLKFIKGDTSTKHRRVASHLNILNDILDKWVYKYRNFLNSLPGIRNSYQRSHIALKNAATRIHELKGLIVHPLFIEPKRINNCYILPRDVLSMVYCESEELEFPVEALSHRYKNMKNYMNERSKANFDLDTLELKAPKLEIMRTQGGELFSSSGKGDFIENFKKWISNVGAQESPGFTNIQFDSFFFCITRALEYGVELSDESQLLKIIKLTTASPKSRWRTSLFLEFDQELLEDHLSNLLFLLKGQNVTRISSFYNAVRRLKVLQLRILGIQDIMNADENLIVEVLHFENEINEDLDSYEDEPEWEQYDVADLRDEEPTADALVYDKIQMSSRESWLQKFEKFPTLQCAISTYDKDCVICSDPFSQARDLAILCVCEHVMCLACAEKMYNYVVIHPM